jgi:hypothetical protein
MSTNTVTTVTSQTNPLAYMKAIATLIGSIVTGLLGVYTADTPVGQVLTVVAIIATAIATWVVPNALVVPVVTDEGEFVGEGEVDDDGLSYEESGGLPFPTDGDEGALYGRPGTLRDETPYDGDAGHLGGGDPHRA